MSAYDLAQQYARTMRWNWPVSPALLYSEPKRLAAVGLVRIEHHAVGTQRTKKVFHITAAGKRELRQWLAQPVTELPALHHELLLRVGFADSGNIENLQTSLNAIEKQLIQLARDGEAQISGYLTDGGLYPERLHLVAPLVDFHSRFLELCLAWSHEMQDHVEAWSSTTLPADHQTTQRQLEEALTRLKELPERFKSR